MTEDEILGALMAQLPHPAAAVAVPAGDDCAAVRIDGDRVLLLAADQVVGDRHYVRTEPCPTCPELVGRKLLARNLSDIAAMGGTPRYCLLSVALGPDRSEAWLLRFFEGLLALAREWAVDVIGGDLAAAPADDVASLTIIGDMPEALVCRRQGAQAGDILAATGRFGDSLPSEHHLRFVPRCREGRWLAENGFARAMIDVSDGLLLDAGRLGRASGLGLELHTGRVPRRTAETSLDAALTDGEDYELVFALAPAQRDALFASWPFPDTELTGIGCFTAANSGRICDEAGHDLQAGACLGFDHFSNCSP